MSGQDVLRERIARAIHANDYVRGLCDLGWGESHVNREAYRANADAVIVALGLVGEVSLGLGWRGDGIARRRFVTEWKPIIEECQCGADITHRDEHHRQSVCVRASGHSGAHDDGQGCVWTGGNQ